MKEYNFKCGEERTIKVVIGDSQKYEFDDFYKLITRDEEDYPGLFIEKQLESGETVLTGTHPFIYSEDNDGNDTLFVDSAFRCRTEVIDDILEVLIWENLEELRKKNQEEFSKNSWGFLEPLRKSISIALFEMIEKF